MARHLYVCTLLALSSFLFTTAASAATIVVPIADSGWYDQTGEHNPANQNYVAGWLNAEYRNFFIFDLSALPAEAVLSATLRAFNPASGNPDITFDDGFESPSASEQYRLVAVAEDPETVALGGSGLTSIFDDLADGTAYGSHLANAGDNGTIVEIALNAAAVAAIDAATGLFALGGYLDSLDKNLDDDEHFFGHTSTTGTGMLRELVITTVPEPGTGLLAALGLTGLALRRRRPRGSRVTRHVSLALCAALTAGLLAGPAQAATEILVLGNRADLLSDDDALVEVLLPPGTDAATVLMDLDGTDVTASFALRPNGRYMGVVDGLSLGANVLTATLLDGSGAEITLTNHPIEGPVFSGIHLQPWGCTRAGADSECNAPPTVSFHYQSTAQPGVFQNYNPGSPPAPGTVRQITIDNGNSVPYIVRQEVGSQNRGVYSFAVIFDPAQPWEPWAQQDGWNGKLFYPYGASCGVSWNQGSAQGVLDDQALSQGFAVATSSLNVLGHHCDTVKSAESVMMLKEHITEHIGEIRYTFGEGLSGGSIGQLQTANAYPGLLQGLIPGLTYPDVWTTAMDVADCILLRDYFNGPGGPVFPSPTQQLAVEGHGTNGVCPAWIALFGPLVYPDNGCSNGAPSYDPDTQIDGCRSTVNELQVNVWGRRPQDNFAKRPYTNDGTQYGLVALLEGSISAEQFVDLNETIGGADIDGEPTAQRTVADEDSSSIAYWAARIDDGRQLDEVAIIDLPSPENVEIHTPYHAFSIEERLKKAHGHGKNHAIWRGGTIDNPGAPAFDTMDTWLAAVEADTTPGVSLADKIVDNRPLVADLANGVRVAKDSCFTGAGQVVYENDDGSENPTLRATCDAAWPFYGGSRTAAGSPLEKDVIQCTLKPLDANDYPPGTFDAGQWTRLQATYPNGVCDYSQLGLGQAPTTPWVTYAGGPGGQALGAAPVSSPFGAGGLPEPGSLVGLAAGALALSGLVLLRRRSAARRS